MQIRRITAHYLYTAGEFIRGGILTLSPDGEVLDISQNWEPDDMAGVEFYSGMLIPGMVNCHAHLELSHMRDRIPAGCGFDGFAEGMSRMRNCSSAAGKEAAADYQDAKMWQEGVQAVGDISNGNLTFGIKARSRTRYRTFVEVYGLGLQTAESGLRYGEELRRAGLDGNITPHSVYSLNEKALRSAVKLSGDGILSVHFMETDGEQALFRNEGYMRDWYDRKGFETDFTGLYVSPTDRITATVPPERRILLIHNTVVTEEDVDRLNAHFGRDVTYVLCPRSNSFISGEAPPIQMLLRKGCRVAIGTDSLASNTSLSLLEEIKILPEIPLEHALKWITLSGAEALGYDSFAGSFEKGKKPGIVLLENLDTGNLRLTPQSSTRRIL